MGLLDLPASVFELLDRQLLFALPPVLRLAFWAVVGGVVSSLLYWALSPQARIAGIKAAAADARRRLNAHDGDLASAGPLIRDSLGLSLRQLGLVLPPALLASLPMLSLLVWLDTAYGRALPPGGAPPAVEVRPAGFEASWRGGAESGRIEVREAPGALVADLAVDRPVPVIEKRRWWNLLIGNPLGYLPAESPLERVTIALPEKHYLPVGPDWARSWLAVVLPLLVAVSLLVHRWARIA